MHMQKDIITIEWTPWEKDESFDAEFQRSLCLLTNGKLEANLNRDKRTKR